ncbi:MAG: hypothetical protein KJ648_07425 [Candidatus Omnitrophica bacterium]|nr:hypothetical protein [Candidatus Omnitrophota bacterium]
MKRAVKIVLVLLVLLYTAAFAGVFTSLGHSPGTIGTPNPASYSTGGYGAALEEEANEDPNTVMYCAVDDADGTSIPQCAISGHRHTGVGPLSPSNSFTMSATTLQYAGDFRVDAVVEVVAATDAVLLSTAPSTYDSGYLTLMQADGSVVFATYGTGPTTTTVTTAAGLLVVGQKNFISFGRRGTNQVLAVNGSNVTDANAQVEVNSDLTMIGSDPDGTTTTASFRLYELSASPTGATTAAADTAWAAVQACRNAGRCLPAQTSETLYLSGDNYLPGGSWCGDYPTCAAAKTFTRVGLPVVAEGRYNWPSLAWAMTGTVPRVSGSAIYRRGYGAERWWLAGFDGSNELVYDAAFDGTTFTACADVTRVSQRSAYVADSGTTLDTLWSNMNAATTEGWAVTSGTNAAFTLGPFTLSWYDTSGTLRSVSTVEHDLPGTDRRLCWGFDGANGWIALNGATPVSAAFDLDPWNAGTMTIGGADTTAVYPGEVGEIMITTMPPTSALLTYLASAPCTAGGGNCIPSTANEVMRCNARDYDLGTKVLGCRTNTIGGTWSSGGTLVKSKRPSVVLNDNRAADGAGPFSNANYFTLGTGDDVLDFADDWHCALVISRKYAIDSGVPFCNYVYNNAGYYLQQSAAGSAVVGFFTNGDGARASITGAALTGDLDILNFGVSGTDQYLKTNGGTSASVGGAKKYPATGAKAAIGNIPGSGLPTDAVFYALWCSTSPFTEASATRIQRRFLNHRGDRDQPITATRTTTGDTYHSAGKVLVAPAGTARQQSTIRMVGTTSKTDYWTHQTTPAGKMIVGTNTNDAQTLAGGGIDSATYAVGDGLTGTNNNALAPDGTMTATTYRDTATTAVHNIPFFGSGRSSACGTYTEVWSWYMRFVGDQTGIGHVFRLHDAGYTSVQGLAYRPATDMFYAVYAGAFTPLVGHEHLADGWIRFWINSKCGGGDIEHLSYDYANATYTYLGDVTRGFDVWGWAHQTNGVSDISTVAPYCGVPSAALVTCNADVVTIPNALRPNGSDWTNILLQSEDLGTTWANVNTAESLNVALAVDGSFTADKLYENDATNGVHYNLQAYTAAAVPTTVSFEAKPAERSWLLVSPDAGASSANFDLSDCSVGAVSAGVTSAATQLSDGWCQVELTKTLAAGATSVRIFLCAAEGTCSYAGVTGSGAYMTRFQITSTPTAQSYCPTTTAARTCGPGGATGKVTTNNALQSETLETAPWTGALITVASNATADPNGYLTAEKLTDSLDGAGAIHRRQQAYTATAVPWAYSQWLKPGTLSWVMLSLDSGVTGRYFNLSDCSIGSAHGAGVPGASFVGPDGWCRLAVSKTMGAGANAFLIYLANADGGVTYQGDGTGTIYAWGSQIEPVAGAGPYCGPTYAAARTCAPQQRWCVRVKDATPLNGGAWKTTIARALWSYRVGVTSNYARLITYTDGYVYFDVFDSIGTLGRAATNVALTDGATYTFTACAKDGVNSLLITTPQGATVASVTGTGASRLQSFASTVNVGSDIGAAAGAFDGTIGSIDFNVTGDPKDFAP